MRKLLASLLVITGILVGVGCSDSDSASAPEGPANSHSASGASAQSADPYPEVKIGDQVWMTKNLDVSKFRNGDPIPEAKTAAEWESAGNSGKPAWSCYDNDPDNCKIYGKLYNWYAVNDSRGLAPSGWHVSTDAEWKTLESYLGGGTVAADKLKETGTSHWQPPKGGGNNTSGFTMLPGGWRGVQIGFEGLGGTAYFWTASEFNSNKMPGNAWSRCLGCASSSLDRGGNKKEGGFSVRCVKD